MESRSPDTTLVLVPSVALLSQIRNDWIIDRKKDFLHLCVCSDPCVEDNEGDSFSAADCDFPVSTSADEVRRFLDFPTTLPKVVFCTYQSTHVIVNAGRHVWDLGIFDEAHKTAGRQGRAFSSALDDGNVPIKKRVFFTATPRHCNPLRKDAEGEAEVVYSMDDETQYGKVAYSLSCRKAVELGIICDYKVLATVFTTAEVNDWLLRHGRVPIKPVIEGGDFVMAWDVANQLAIAKAYDEYGVKKTFSFHSRVKAAKDFVSDGVQGIGSHLKDVECRSVDGTMNMGDRRKIMEVIKDSPRALLANAKCLTEGVNLPSVDCVAFLSPKRSRIDVAQAMGRGMRKNGCSKETGHVIVPVYVALGEGENFEEAIKRAKFDTVLEVLQTLKEIDDSFADFLKELPQPKKRAKGSSDWRLSEHVEFIAPTVLLEQLVETIRLECIDGLVPSWDKMYAELVAYKEIHGDCNVIIHSGRLGTWCNNVRQGYKTGQLSSERIAQLEALGFCWDPFAVVWNKKFAELVAYKENHGDCNVLVESGPLGRWASKQRSTCTIPERVARLNSIDFCWDPFTARWDEKIADLKAFKEANGHCTVPRGTSLGDWCGWVRASFKRGELTTEQITQLEGVGFYLIPYAARWNENIAELIAYKKAHGDCNVPNYSGPLGTWVSELRKHRRKGKLSSERIAQLEALGFCWDPFAAVWNKKFAELVAYKEANGHCNVTTDNDSLSSWCVGLRQRYRTGRLGADKIAQLEGLGFCWTPFTDVWNKRIAELIAYKEAHGHCNVSADSGVLGRWVANTRTNCKNGVLSSERIAQLDAIGFCWNPLDTLWDKMFTQLAAYKKANGNCDVPANSSSLGNWCKKQRCDQKKGTLSPERIAQLDALGFCWQFRSRTVDPAPVAAPVSVESA
jgi:superfamily II DNA or RNA helicase